MSLTSIAVIRASGSRSAYLAACDVPQLAIRIFWFPFGWLGPPHQMKLATATIPIFERSRCASRIHEGRRIGASFRRIGGLHHCGSLLLSSHVGPGTAIPPEPNWLELAAQTVATRIAGWRAVPLDRQAAQCCALSVRMPSTDTLSVEGICSNQRFTVKRRTFHVRQRRGMLLATPRRTQTWPP